MFVSLTSRSFKKKEYLNIRIYIFIFVYIVAFFFFFDCFTCVVRMPVGSVLMALLAEDRPRGKRHVDSSSRAHSRTSLRETNLSREKCTNSPYCTRHSQGRRYFPFSTQSSFTVGAAPRMHSGAKGKEDSPSKRSSQKFRIPDQLGLNMTAKNEAPPSPRHKVYVRPESFSHSKEEIRSSSRAHSRGGWVPHMFMGSLIPKDVWPKEVEKVEPIVLKPVKTGIRTFKSPAPEKPLCRGVRMIHHASEKPSLPFFVENEDDNAAKVLRRNKGSFEQHQKSGFSIAHNDSYSPPDYKRQLKRVDSRSRSKSVNIFSWYSPPKVCNAVTAARAIPAAATTSAASCSTPTRCSRYASRMNQSHFTLTYQSDKPCSDNFSARFSASRVWSATQRSSSVDCISWRGTGNSKSRPPSPPKSGRRSGSCMPTPRGYDIISGCPR